MCVRDVHMRLAYSFTNTESWVSGLLNMTGLTRCVHDIIRFRYPYKLVALSEANLEANVSTRTEKCGVHANKRQKKLAKWVAV